MERGRKGEREKQSGRRDRDRETRESDEGREKEKEGEEMEIERGEGERKGERVATNCIYRPQRSVTEALCSWCFLLPLAV